MLEQLKILFRGLGRDIICVIVLMICVSLFAFYGLGRYDFLWNEPISISYSSLSWQDLIGQIYHKTFFYPDFSPFYFMLLKWWRAFFGSSAVDVRSFSVLAYGFLIGAFYIVCRKVNIRMGIALFCSGALALDPKILFFAQEARWYELSLFFGVICMGEFLLLMRLESRPISLFLIVGLLGQLTFYSFTSFFIFCLGCLLILSPISNNKKFILFFCALFELFISTFGSILQLYQYRFEIRRFHQQIPADVLNSLANLFSQDFPIHNMDRHLFLIMGVIALLGVFISRLYSKEIRLLVFYVFLSIVLLWVVQFFLHLDEISLRYISIIYPIIFLLAALTIEYMMQIRLISGRILIIASLILGVVGINDFIVYQKAGSSFVSVAGAVDYLEEIVGKGHYLSIRSDNPRQANDYVVCLLQARLGRSLGDVKYISLNELNDPNLSPSILILFNPPPPSLLGTIQGKEYRPWPWPNYLFIGKNKISC